jgi:hypothetical protein
VEQADGFAARDKNFYLGFQNLTRGGRPPESIKYQYQLHWPGCDRESGLIVSFGSADTGPCCGEAGAQDLSPAYICPSWQLVIDSMQNASQESVG